MSNKNSSLDSNVKVHMFYLILIMSSLIIFLFTQIGYSNKDLASQISFGATLSGIILSIIAIIMTLIGETKSDNTKNQLVSLSKNLEGIVYKMEKTTDDLTNVINTNVEVKNQLSTIGNALENKINLGSKEVTAIKDDKFINHKENQNYYEFMINEAKVNLEFSIFKDLCITILYLDAKISLGAQSVAYEEYLEDINSLNLNIDEKNKHLVWNMAFIFNGGLWKKSELVDYIYYTYSSNYYQYFNIINQYKNSSIKYNTTPKEIKQDAKK